MDNFELDFDSLLLGSQKAFVLVDDSESLGLEPFELVVGQKDARNDQVVLLIVNVGSVDDFLLDHRRVLGSLDLGQHVASQRGLLHGVPDESLVVKRNVSLEDQQVFLVLVESLGVFV